MDRATIHLTRDDRLAITRASKKLRYVFDIHTKKMAKDINFGLYYFHQLERGDVPGSPSDAVITAIANYFNLDFLHLVEIGNQCKTPIDTFLYLQKIGRLTKQKEDLK